MDKDRFKDFDEEERQLVLDFEDAMRRGDSCFFDVDELEVIIDYYFEVNDMPALERAVEYAEQLYPDSNEVRLRRAHVMIAHEDYEPALRIIKELRRQEPDNTDVAYSLGVVYGAMGEHEKAIQYYMETVADGWMLGRVYANIAEEYFFQHNFDEAIRYYLLALDTDSYDSSTLYNYVDTATQAGRLDEAVDYLKSFVEEHPYSAEGWHCLGTAYFNMGLCEKAVDAYEYSLAIDKNNANVYHDMADAQEVMGQMGEAITTLLRACDVEPNRAMIYQAVADIYVRNGNNEMAMLYLRKAVDEDPDNACATASLALIYALSGENGQAVPLIRKALRMAPEDARVLSIAGIIYDRMGNYDAACEYFSRMVASDGCDEIMCQHYVEFLFNHGDYDLLIEFAEESLALYPGNPYYSTYMAAACYYTNRYNRASRVLPHADPEMLLDICPDIANHPRLWPLVPKTNEK